MAEEAKQQPELTPLENTTSADDKKYSTRSRRKVKCKSKYQTEDLIREISPQPPPPPPPPLEELEPAKSDKDEIKKEVAVEPMDESNTVAAAAAVTVAASAIADLSRLEPAELGKRMVQCNICRRQMTEAKLANHIRLLHFEKPQEDSQDKADDDTKRKKFRCDNCGKLYATKYTYQQHMKTHIEGRPKCPECGATFASAFSLFRHRAKNHNLEHNYQTHCCDQCDKSFFSISELKLHQQRHSSKKEFVCEICQKAFAVKGNLKIHMRTHAKEKLYKCDICESTFSHPYSLVSHRRIHTNDFPYKCPKCDKAYRSKHQLTSHMNVHSDNRPFKCTSCTKTFKSRTAFKMHQDEHMGIKRFKCKECGRLFQCHGNKLKHERRHIGDKKHKCLICDKAFIEKQELKNHSKVHEKRPVSPASSQPPLPPTIT